METNPTTELTGLALFEDEAAHHAANGTVFTVSVTATSAASFAGGDCDWLDVLDWFELEDTDEEFIYGTSEATGERFMIEI